MPLSNCPRSLLQSAERTNVITLSVVRSQRFRDNPASCLPINHHAVVLKLRGESTADSMIFVGSLNSTFHSSQLLSDWEALRPLNLFLTELIQHICCYMIYNDADLFVVGYFKSILPSIMTKVFSLSTKYAMRNKL